MFALVVSTTCSFTQPQHLPVAPIERWGRFEITLKGPAAGNPFTDQWVKAEFRQGARKIHQTAQADTNYYIVYFGKQIQHEWVFNLPKKNAPAAGARFRVEIIDTWNMSVIPVENSFEQAQPDGYRVFDKQLKKIQLPFRPWQALRITRIKQ